MVWKGPQREKMVNVRKKREGGNGRRVIAQSSSKKLFRPSFLTSKGPPGRPQRARECSPPPGVAVQVERNLRPEMWIVEREIRHSWALLRSSFPTANCNPAPQHQRAASSGSLAPSQPRLP